MRFLEVMLNLFNFFIVGVIRIFRCSLIAESSSLFLPSQNDWGLKERSLIAQQIIVQCYWTNDYLIENEENKEWKTSFTNLMKLTILCISGEKINN